MTYRATLLASAAVLIVACSSDFDTIDSTRAAAEGSCPEPYAMRPYAAAERAERAGTAYECKPFPYSGWCGMGGGYEPGVGSVWQDAWIELGPCQGGSGTPGSCDASPWQKGKQYRAGDIVQVTDGNYYVAERDNPGYDPTISTWFWEPHDCSGSTGSGGAGGNPGSGGCNNAEAWQQGKAYNTGDVVLYDDGNHYLAEHDNPGYDPIISTWVWEPHDCSGSTGGGGTGGAPGSGTCKANPWQQGAQYHTGDVVQYSDGNYYIAERDNPGYDPTISTWFWEPYDC
jgi:chitodextrinase